MQFVKPDINIPFLRYSRVAGFVSVGLVVASMVLAAVPGPNYGIDFKGGTEIQFRLSTPMDIGRMRASIGRAGFKKSDLVRIGRAGDRYRVRLEAVTTLTKEDSAKVRALFAKAFKDQVLEDFRLSPGGDKIMVVFEQKVAPEKIEKVAVEAGLKLRELDRAQVLFEMAGSSKTGSAEPEEEGELSAEEKERCLEPVCLFGRPEDNTYEIFLQGVADTFLSSLATTLGDVKLEVEEIEWVGPAVGRQLRDAGIKSILYAMGLILLYVAFRFDLRFAPGAVVCLFHDVLITLGIFVVLRREVSLPTIAALLTIIGYSLNDTIVVFDRIRENLSKIRERDLKLVVNKSINETLSRTIMTSLTTFLAILPILILARGTIQNFAIALTIGILTGTYSSIYIAAPIAVWVDQTFFVARRKKRRPKKG
jgi:preprotein translocase subunit SecF